MTSKICGSNVFHQWEIFKIVRVDRLKKNTISYIFVGNQETEIKNILSNLENDKKLISKDEKKLKEKFGNNYSKIVKNKTKKIKFIYQGIYTDDTISTIRKKIFAFLSTRTDILIEQNQELWVKMCDKKLKILGPTWTNLIASPSILEKDVQPDYKKFISKNGQVILTEQVININDQTLFDATQGLNFEGNEIFLHMMEDDVRYLSSKGKKVDKMLLEGYFLKFWAHFVVDYDSSKMYDESERMKNILKTEDKLIQFVEKVPIENDLMTGCRIIQVLVHITNPYEHEFVDLLKIFNLFNLDEKTPFMRYKDYEWPAPLYLIYKPMVENKIISEKQIKDWVSATKKVKDASDQVIKEIQYSVRGLTMKRFIYKFDEESKYATINIHKNGNMEIRIAFKEKQAATMKDVYNALMDIGKLINKINEIDYRFRQRKTPSSVKLLTPDVTFNEKQNLLQFHGRTRLILMDAINGVNLPEEYNFKEINLFASKYFTPYLSPVLSRKGVNNKTALRKKEQTEMLMKYKRVSFYSKMNIEYEFIHKTILQNPNIQPKDVVQLLHENYYLGKPIEEAIKVYKDWERKYGYMGSQGVKGARQTGIEIKIKGGKIHLNGSKSTYQLTNASVFISKFLNIFFNQSKYLKKAKNIFSNELANLDIIENNINMNINENIMNTNLLNYNNTLGNIYNNEYYENINVEENVNENTNNIENNSKYLATDNEIDQNIRMQCEDQDKSKDVCVDFCEDSFYTLRRLQKYDNPIFKFRSDPKFINYARQCQPQERQPLVMRFDPSKNPKIDPKSYKNAIQYGSSPDRQNWYICAQVWCPHEEIPISYDLIKDKIITREMRGGKCLTAECPSCLKEKRTTWLRIVEKSKFNPYVGFIDNSNHPNHLCMPCCFKKPMDDPKSKKYAMYMKCLGQNVESSKNGEGKEYIMGREKMPLTTGRYGLLPINLAKLFLSRCETGKMQPNMTCHLRYGVKDDIRQSFLQAIVGCVQSETSMNLTILKKYLFETKLNKKIFMSLNQGELEILFEDNKTNSFENYKKYMMSETQKITEEYLWDYLQRPGILEKKGINIFIFTSKSVLCPKGFNAKEFYDLDRKSIILYTDGRYFEPIFKVSNVRGSLKEPVKMYDEGSAEIAKIYNMVVNNCVSKNIISWDKIRKKSLGENYFELKPQISAKELLKKGIKIIGQIKDSYNKTYGLISDDYFILPVLPQGEILELPVANKFTFKSPKVTIKYYFDISKKYDLPYEPQNVYKENSGEIIAITLQDGAIIPTRRDKYSTNLVESPDRYYYEVNKYIEEKKIAMDERAKTTVYLIYIQESYDRLRMEFSRYLQKIPEREKIVSLIKDKQLPKKLQREYMKNIVSKISKKLVLIMDKLPFEIENYEKPKLRRTCGSSGKTKDKCVKNPHCYFKDGNCKLIILKKSPVDGTELFPFFVERISEELLRNNMLRDEILEDKLDEIIDKTIEIRNDEIVIYGAKDLLGQVQNLYKPKKEFELKNVDLFSTTEPNYKGVNKEKYLSTEKELTLDTLNLETLPGHWKQLFGSNTKYYDDKTQNNTLYYSILRALIVIAPEIRNVLTLKNLQLDKITYITKQDIDKNPDFKEIGTDIIDSINRIIAIYKDLYKSVYKNINTITQLKEFIMNDEYPANEVDIFLLAHTIGLNIIVLEKRVKKNNKKGFYGFMSNMKKDFIVLLEQNRMGKTIYNIVGRKNNYIFKKKELPKPIKEYYGIRNEQENRINYKVPHMNNSNNSEKVRAKMRKVKLEKRKLEKKKK